MFIRLYTGPMPGPRFTRNRILIAVAATLAGLIVIGYLSLPHLLAGLVQVLARDYDIRQVRMEPGYPGLRSWHIHRLELKGASFGNDYTFDADNLTIEYNLLTLLHGRILRLVLPTATLELSPVTAAPATRPDATLPSIILPEPGSWLAKVPLQELEIGSMQVKWVEGGTTHALQLQGQARIAENTVDTHWSMTRTNQHWATFDAQLAADGTLHATVYQPSAGDRPVLRVEISRVVQGSSSPAMNATLDAQFKPLAAVLAPWLSLPRSVQPIDGRLQVRWTAEDPAKPPPTRLPSSDRRAPRATLRLELSGVQFGKLVQDGRAQVDARLAIAESTLHVDVASTTQLSARLHPSLLALTSGGSGHRDAFAPEPMRIRLPEGLSVELVPSAERFGLNLLSKATVAIEQLQTLDVTIPSLKLSLPDPVRLSCRSERRRCETGGVAILLRAPSIRPHFAEIGTIENFELAGKVEAGVLSLPPKAAVRHVSMNLLGGRVSGNDLRFDPSRELNLFRIELDQLDLDRIVHLEQQEQIEASGRLSGTLPIQLSARGVRVEDGRLQAAAPGGVIRYLPTESVRETAESNPNLKLVLQALSNYHYDSLNVGILYAENGDLTAQLALTGRNPDWNAGQAINLNVNLSENIPTLLHSLRLSGQIESEVEKRVRERPAPKR